MDVYGLCTEIWGSSSVLNVGVNPPPSTNPIYAITCAGVGHPPSGSGFEGEWDVVFNNLWNTQTKTWGPHAFAWSTHPFIKMASADTGHYTLNVQPMRPSNGTAIPITCAIDAPNGAATVNINVTGPTPTLQSIDFMGGPAKMTPGSIASFAVTGYTDNYNYSNAMSPQPTFSYSSSNPSAATVDPTTGLVTAVANGLTDITATGPGSVFKKVTLTVTSCTAVALTPNTTQQLYFNGPTTNVVAGLTCPQGIDPGKEPVDWTSTPAGIVSLTPYGTYGHGVTINPNLDGGVTTVKACTRYVNKVCGQVTVNVARLVITTDPNSPYDSIPPSTVEHIGYFTVFYKGAGPSLSFSFSCGSTGAITCNGQPTPASQTLIAGQTLVPTMNFTTASYTGPATIGIGATDLGGNLPFTNLGIPVTVTNHTGSPLSVNLQAIVDVKVNTACTWNTGTYGGTTPYHYTWTVNGSGVGDDSPTLNYAFGRTGTYTLAVTVADGAGGQATASQDVTVHTDWTGCLQ